MNTECQKLLLKLQSLKKLQYSLALVLLRVLQNCNYTMHAHTYIIICTG